MPPQSYIPMDYREEFPIGWLLPILHHFYTLTWLSWKASPGRFKKARLLVASPPMLYEYQLLSRLSYQTLTPTLMRLSPDDPEQQLLSKLSWTAPRTSDTSRVFKEVTRDSDHWTLSPGHKFKWNRIIVKSDVSVPYMISLQLNNILVLSHCQDNIAVSLFVWGGGGQYLKEFF